MKRIILFLLVASLNATYIGCFKDAGDPNGLKGRDLNKFFMRSSDMTIEKCINACKKRGFKYAGVQYYSWCFCDNNYGKYGPSNNCHTKCVGNNNQICGGEWANSIYSTTKSNTNNIEFNIDRPGSDYKSFDLKINNFLLCKDACENDKKCKAWTYVKPGIQGPNAKCWLKNSIPTPYHNPNTISGIQKD